MRVAAAAIFCGLLPALLPVPAADGQNETALDRYVAAADPSYRYQLLNTAVGESHTAYVLELTSQQWRTGQEVDRPVWKHWLTIVRPEHATTSTSLLIVSGGSNDKPPP